MRIPDHLRPGGAALVVVLGLALGACSDGDTADAAAPDEPADTDEAAEAATEVSLVDYAFVGLPDTLAAGSRLTVVNDADEELHELVAFRLPDDEDRAVAELAELAPGDLVAALGEPETVILAEPGGDPIPAVGDGTLSEPGRYAVMCFIPTGVDPQEYLEVAAETEEGPPQVDGGPPHFVNGMFAELAVE